MLSNLSVKHRLIALLLVVLLVPLATANAIWLAASQSQLRAAASAHETLLVQSSAAAVTSYLDNKINLAIVHSQTAAVQGLNVPAASSELVEYLKQDADITAASLVDATGTQRVLVTRSGVSTSPVNVGKSDAFRVVTFLGGEEYLSPVSRGQMTLAVPLINFDSAQNAAALSTSQPGVILPPTAIHGALIVQINLQSLWGSVLGDRLGASGYAYITDDQGRLVAYPSASYAGAHPDFAAVPEVKSALAQTNVPGAAQPAPAPHITRSETGAQVLSSHLKIARANWIVVAEEPLASVYAPVTSQFWIAGLLFVTTGLLGLLLIIWLARSLLRPIQALTDGAMRLADGDLDYRIHVASMDEFRLLASTLNAMGARLQADFIRMREVDRLKNEFIAIASHNLRTPVTIMNGYLEDFKRESHTLRAKRMADAFEKSTLQLSGFSEDLLTISSIESGAAVISVEPVSVAELLDPLKADIEALAADKQIGVDWAIPDGSFMLKLSPMHMRRVIFNLLENAVEFSPHAALIEFNLRITPNEYVMTVTDHGAGISHAEMEHLFTKFHRGTDTLKYDHPGTGIGLYATLLIVKAHGGHINVKSALGSGSTFTVSIPA